MKNFNRNYTGELNDLAGASLYLGLCKVKGIELDELSRIDTLTPFYRNKINQLSPQKRKILATLVREGKPLRIRELSESARITQYGVVSTQVGRLVKIDLIKRDSGGKYTLNDQDPELIKYLNARLNRQYPTSNP